MSNIQLLFALKCIVLNVKSFSEIGATEINYVLFSTLEAKKVY